MTRTKKCPHCAAELPEEAAFCPHCAVSIAPRTAAGPPRLWRKPLRSALVLLAVLTAGVLCWQAGRPRVYDQDSAELLYTLDGAAYQIAAGWIDNPVEGARTLYQPVEETEILHTFPQCLYVNDPANGSDAREPFMAQVKQVTARFIQTENEAQPWYCDAPVHRPEYAPRAVLVASLHFTARSGEGEMVWEVEMKNGDLLRLHQSCIAQPYQVLRFTPEDTPMDTIAELQALADSLPERLSDTCRGVEITLPPVRYEGGLRVSCPLTLTGSEDGAGNRTTFTGPVQFVTGEQGMSYLENIDIAGPGEGVGVSANVRLHLTGCRVSGWRTGVLAYGHQVWVNLRECAVEDNTIGFHLNAAGCAVSRSIYDGNLFRRNGTAVLLESLPGVETISFPGCRFAENGADIRNPFQQALDLDGAVFE